MACMSLIVYLSFPFVSIIRIYNYYLSYITITTIRCCCLWLHSYFKCVISVTSCQICKIVCKIMGENIETLTNPHMEKLEEATLNWNTRYIQGKIELKSMLWQAQTEQIQNIQNKQEYIYTHTHTLLSELTFEIIIVWIRWFLFDQSVSVIMEVAENIMLFRHYHLLHTSTTFCFAVVQANVAFYPIIHHRNSAAKRTIELKNTNDI